ncbi:MAG: hypothetical protein WCZ13_01155 [Acholeplasmataceae bacterium]
MSFDAYELKIFGFIDKYEQVINTVIRRYDDFFLSVMTFFKLVLKSFSDILDLTTWFMRYSTFPLHMIWIWWDIRTYRLEHVEIEQIPIFEIGAQYMYGRPGSGKSTCTYHLMMDYAYRTGKCSLTTDLMETARTDTDGTPYYYHQLFNPSDYFVDGEQIAQFDSDRFNIIVYEEMLTKYQQRNNAKKSYNDEVLPMISAMGTQRHQGIDLFFFISQLPRNDIAIMQMLKGYHEPKIKKGFDYHYWLQTGKIRFHIKGWKITSHRVENIDSSNFKLVDKRVWFYPCVYQEDMQYFNRLNMKEKYKALPKVKGVKMTA